MNTETKLMSGADWAKTVAEYVDVYFRANAGLADARRRLIRFIVYALTLRHPDALLSGDVGRFQWKSFVYLVCGHAADEHWAPSEGDVVEALFLLSTVRMVIGNASVTVFVVRFPHAEDESDTVNDWLVWRLGPDYVELVHELQAANESIGSALRAASEGASTRGDET